MAIDIQLDPSAEVSVRPGAGGTSEIVIQGPSSDASGVIELSNQQLAAICEDASEQ
jgi:hypothetical protein